MMQVLVGFDNGSMITVLPKYAVPPFALVIFLTGAASINCILRAITFGPVSLIRRWT
jgi:hypothetical protein